MSKVDIVASEIKNDIFDEDAIIEAFNKINDGGDVYKVISDILECHYSGFKDTALDDILFYGVLRSGQLSDWSEK